MTDPTMLATAIDSAAARGVLAVERRLVLLAGPVTAAGSDTLAESFFPLALARGADPHMLTEIVLQTHLFAGYPRTINALFALRAAGASAPTTADETDPARLRARGEALCSGVYGSNYDALRRNIRALHPDLDTWMVDEGYGRVLSRPGVDAVTRELAALGALIVLDVPRQLDSHLRGARNVGASDSEIDETIEQSGVVAGTRAMEDARTRWATIRTPRR